MTELKKTDLTKCHEGVERETGEGFHMTVDWCRVVVKKNQNNSFGAMRSYRDTVTDICKHTKKPFENQ